MLYVSLLSAKALFCRLRSLCHNGVSFSWSFSTSDDGVNVLFGFLKLHQLYIKLKSGYHLEILHMTTYSNHSVPQLQSHHRESEHIPTLILP